VSRAAAGVLQAVIGIGALLAAASPAQAVPSFARKYETSCQTCHIVFPKLNAFGEAFRLRGYRLPGETEQMVKQPPVSLGAPAYKRLWPQAVWPGEISSSVPLAGIVKMDAAVSHSTVNDDGSVTAIHGDLRFPQEVNLFGAGTLGEHVSYLAEVTFAEQPDGSVGVSLEHAHMGFDSPFGPEDLLHVRIGKLAPNVVSGFQEMWISTNAGIDTMFDYNPIGVRGGTGLGAGDARPSPIAMPVLVRGVEGYGIIHHRALWVAGVSNGIGPGPNDTTGRFDGNNAKDVYARFDYKIGGMGLDGDTGGQQTLPAENWRDNSLRVGVFTYRGDGSGISFPVAGDLGSRQTIQDLHFLRRGIYANAFVQDLNVFGAYVRGTDSLRVLDPAAATVVSSIEPDYHAWFAQADYLIYPWLQATYRYETVTPADRSVASLRTSVANVSALVRANVKAMIEYQRDMRNADNHSLNALLRFGF
jgi:hypothetical protein